MLVSDSCEIRTHLLAVRGLRPTTRRMNQKSGYKTYCNVFLEKSYTTRFVGTMSCNTIPILREVGVEPTIFGL